MSKNKRRHWIRLLDDLDLCQSPAEFFGKGQPFIGVSFASFANVAEFKLILPLGVQHGNGIVICVLIGVFLVVPDFWITIYPSAQPRGVVSRPMIGETCFLIPFLACVAIPLGRFYLIRHCTI